MLGSLAGMARPPTDMELWFDAQLAAAREGCDPWDAFVATTDKRKREAELERQRAEKEAYRLAHLHDPGLPVAADRRLRRWRDPTGREQPRDERERWFWAVR
jgi:hypothetical protein